MSYDLFFDVSSGDGVDKKSFARHFKARRHYQVGQGQAIYQNEDTGVSFIFDEPEDEVVAFNLNYYRPHVFGLEAAVELEAFAAGFGLTVVDPQDDEAEGPVAFERARFLQAWNEGNRLAYRALLKEESEPVPTWPTQRIQEVWEWNYGRPSEESRTAESLFVPGIFAAELDGAVGSLVIWPGCSILLPAVDAVLVPVDPSDEANENWALVRWSEVLPLVEPYQVDGAGPARYRLEFEHWPEDLAAFWGTRREVTGQLAGIGLDQVLNQELVEEAGSGR